MEWYKIERKEKMNGDKRNKEKAYHLNEGRQVETIEIKPK